LFGLQQKLRNERKIANQKNDTQLDANQKQWDKALLDNSTKLTEIEKYNDYRYYAHDNVSADTVVKKLFDIIDFF